MTVVNEMTLECAAPGAGRLERIRVLPVVDSALRPGFFYALKGTEEFDLLAERPLASLQTQIGGAHPDVVAIAVEDISLLEGSATGFLQKTLWQARGILFTPTVNAHAKRLAASLKIASVLPMDLNRAQLLAAIRATASCLVVSFPRLATSLSEVSEPGSFKPGQVPMMENLTTREATVLRLMALGRANREIAEQLGISDHTAKFHVSSILAKLGAASRTEAVTIGILNGLVAI